MNISQDDVTKYLDTALDGVYPENLTLTKDNRKFDLTHQIRKVFPDIAADFESLRTQLDAAFAVECQVEQIKTLIPQVRLNEGDTASEAKHASSVAEMEYLDRKLAPATEEVKELRETLVQRNATVAERKLTRPREQKARTELTEKIRMLLAVTDRLMLSWKSKAGGAKYFLLGLERDADPNCSKLDKLKLSFPDWHAATERYVRMRADLDVTWNNIVSQTDSYRKHRLATGATPAQAKDSSDWFRCRLVFEWIGQSYKQVVECGKEIEREEQSVASFVGETFDADDDIHRAIEEFTRGSCAAARSGRIIDAGLARNLRAAGLME